MNEDQENQELANRQAEMMEQMELVLADERLIIDRSDKLRVITADRFQHWYPARYKAACKLLATGQFTDKDIADFVCADFRTIKEVRLTRIADVNKEREIMRPKFFAGTMVLQERVMEVAQDCKDIKALSIAMGIHKDAYFAASGMPALTIDVNHHFDLGAELRKLEEVALEKMRQAKARVIEPDALEDGATA